MKPVESITWPRNVRRAARIQDALRERVKVVPLRKEPRFIAAVDAAFIDDRVIAAVCVHRFPGLVPVETAQVVKKGGFPYIPGFLSFREGPAVIAALGRLKTPCDLVIFDGQGIAHPRGLGLASHLGVVLDIPSIGCAKSRLVGDFDEPGPGRGDWSPLAYRGAVVGAVLRTKDRTRPLFVSPGHRIDLAGVVDILLRCSGGYRLPEPPRCADLLSKEIKRGLRDDERR